MNKRNTSRKNTFMVLVKGRYLAGFRLLRSGFDYGLSDLKADALEFNSRSDAVCALEVLTLLSRLDGVIVSSSWLSK